MAVGGMGRNAEQTASALLHHNGKGPRAARPGRGGFWRAGDGHSARIAGRNVNLTEAWNRLRDRLRRDRLGSELAEELRFHQAMLERDQAQGGASQEEMQRRASLALGNATYHRERARELWSLGWVDDVLQDL